MMRIVICGTGALACRFGAALAAHNEITLVGTWQAQIDALNDGPLRVTGTDGREQHVKLAARHSTEPIPSADVALVLTKSARTKAAARVAEAALTAGGIAVTLQNGLGNQETLAQLIPAERVVSGITMSGAALDGPGLLRLARRSCRRPMLMSCRCRGSRPPASHWHARQPRRLGLLDRLPLLPTHPAPRHFAAPAMTAAT